jgi:hypothetical protein
VARRCTIATSYIFFVLVVYLKNGPKELPQEDLFSWEAHVTTLSATAFQLRYRVTRERSDDILELFRDELSDEDVLQTGRSKGLVV